MSIANQLLLLPLLILVNAFFVAAEYALVSIRRPEIAGLHARGHRRVAGRLSRLRRNMSQTLGGIQVCITMTNLLLGWIGEPAMTHVLLKVLSPLGLVIPQRMTVVISTTLAFVVVTLATVVMSELLPKALTLQHTRLIARLVAEPLSWVLQAIRPLVWIMDRLANLLAWMLGLGGVRIEEPAMGVEELRAIALDAGQRGTLKPQEQALILNTLGLSAIRADAVMVPRVHMACLDLQRSMDENREVMERHLYSRLPLISGNVDQVVGIVYTKEFLAAYGEATDSSVLQLIARPAVFAPATISVDRLLALFIEKRVRMIVLVDEYGGVDGIVTLSDVMDELLKIRASLPLE